APFFATSILSPDIIYWSYFGAVGGVHKSANLGANWTAISTVSNSWAIDIARDDPNMVMYATDNLPSQTYLSVNGGTNFISSGSLNDYVPALLIYDRKTILLQGSIGFY